MQDAVFGALRARSASLALLWVVGCSTGYRVSDMLQMRHTDVLNERVSLRESKTGKWRCMELPPKVYKLVQEHIRDQGLDDLDHFLFFGKSKATPISRQHAHRVLKSVGAELGLANIGTHSMRKTYAYNVLLATRSFAHVKDALNHAYMSTTFLYLVDGLTAMLPRPGRSGIPPSAVW